MAKTFYEAHWELIRSAAAYDGDGKNLNQNKMRRALFDLLHCCEDARRPNGDKIGPFETVDELSAFLENCAERGDDHLLIREFEGGAAHVVGLDKDGNVKEYSGLPVSPESYLEMAAPADCRAATAPREPNGWDWFCDKIRSIFNSRDPVVKAYEDYKARRNAFLNAHGFGENAAAVTEADVAVEAPEDKVIYDETFFGKDKEDVVFIDEEDPEAMEKNKLREALLPEKFGYKINDLLRSDIHRDMDKLIDGNMPAELAGTSFGEDFEPYRNFAYTVCKLGEENKKMRDAFMLLSHDGFLGKIYKAYKSAYGDGKELDLEGIMTDAINGKKTDLVKVIRNEKIPERTFNIPGLNG